MYKTITRVVLLCVFCLGLASSSVVGAPASCAVLPFESGGVLTEAETQSLMYRFDQALRRNGALQVITRGETSQRLALRKYDPMTYTSSSSAAIAAGKALDVEYVIFGEIEQWDNRWYLETSLVDVRQFRYVNRIRSFLEDTRERFLLLAPASNAKDLLADVTLRSSPSVPPQTVSPEPPTATPPAQAPGRVGTKPRVPGMGTARAPQVTGRGFDVRQGKGTGVDRALELVAGKLEFGTRLIVRTLISENKDNFLGSVDHLELDEDLFPTDVFFAWFFTRDIGIELEWDTIEADTITTTDGHNDGRVKLGGPVISLVARFPIENAPTDFLNSLTPYAGVGIAILRGDFEAEGWWHHGFSHPDWHAAEQRYTDWVASGRPAWPNGGYQRDLSVGNSIGFLVTGGCTAAIGAIEGLSADVYIRYMNIKSESTVVLSRYDEVIEAERTADLPFHNLTFGFGLRYAF